MKNFTFFGGGDGQNSFGGPREEQGNSITKIRKSLIQRGGPNRHQKFQHSSSIRKYLKIGGTDA